MPHTPAAPRRSCERLAAYARTGRLICAGQAPSLDEYDRPMVFPVNLARKVADHGATFTGSPTRQADAGDTPPLVIWQGPGAEGADAIEAVRTELLPLLGTGHRPGGLLLRGVPPEVTVTRWERDPVQAVCLVNSGSDPVSGIGLSGPNARRSVRTCADGEWVEPRSQPGVAVVLPRFRASCVAIVGPSQRRNRGTMGFP
jgi:hypothetical protein